jgi:hypothetical protein
MKYIIKVFYLEWFSAIILKNYDTLGHRVSKDNLAEEWLILFKSIVLMSITSLFVVVPLNILGECYKINEQDFYIMKMVISRKIKNNEVYVGKSLFLDPYLSTYLKIFPDMQKIYCKRNCDDCFKSYVTLLYNISVKNNKFINETNFDIFIKNIYYTKIAKTRININDIIFDHIIEFNNWCDNPKKELINVIEFFNIILKKNKIIEYKENKSIQLPDNLLIIYNKVVKELI